MTFEEVHMGKKKKDIIKEHKKVWQEKMNLNTANIHLNVDVERLEKKLNELEHCLVFFEDYYLRKRRPT